MIKLLGILGGAIFLTGCVATGTTTYYSPANNSHYSARKSDYHELLEKRLEKDKYYCSHKYHTHRDYEHCLSSLGWRKDPKGHYYLK